MKWGRWSAFYFVSVYLLSLFLATKNEIQSSKQLLINFIIYRRHFSRTSTSLTQTDIEWTKIANFWTLPKGKKKIFIQLSDWIDGKLGWGCVNVLLLLMKFTSSSAQDSAFAACSSFLECPDQFCIGKEHSCCSLFLSWI